MGGRSYWWQLGEYLNWGDWECEGRPNAGRRHFVEYSMLRVKCC
jgi:hypothetical protein